MRRGNKEADGKKVVAGRATQSGYRIGGQAQFLPAGEYYDKKISKKSIVKRVVNREPRTNPRHPRTSGDQTRTKLSLRPPPAPPSPAKRKLLFPLIDPCSPRLSSTVFSDGNYAISLKLDAEVNFQDMISAKMQRVHLRSSRNTFPASAQRY